MNNLSFNFFSNLSSNNFNDLSEEVVRSICNICDKVEVEAISCPLRHFGFCKADSKIEQSNHILSRDRSNDSGLIRKRKEREKYRGLHKVYNSDHGWLTKPLSILDYEILSKLSLRQRRILQLLYLGKTQAQIARILKISRQAVHKHVKKFEKWDFVRKKGSIHGLGRGRDIVYEVRLAIVNFLKLNRQPRNKGG